MKKNHTETDIDYLTGLLRNSCTLADTSQPMKTVHDVCKETGITRKTLFYYDKMYSSSAIAKLKTIMAYQSCGLTLKEIDAILNQDGDEEEIMQQAKTRLSKTMKKLEHQIRLLDALLQSRSEQ